MLEEVALPPIGGSPRTDCLRGTGVIVDFHQHRFGEAFAACGCLALNFWRDQLDLNNLPRRTGRWIELPLVAPDRSNFSASLRPTFTLSLIHI